MLAEVFVALGVPHVIFFDFTQLNFYKISLSSLSVSFDSAVDVPYECIYAFCQEFYKRLVRGDSVQKSLDQGKEKVKVRLREINKVLKLLNLHDKHIGDGAMLLPEDFDHEVSLYGNKDWMSTELKKGSLIDMSRIRGPTNVSKSLKPTTGRRIETYKLTKYLVENKIVSLYGVPGVGKTHLARSVSYYCN